MYQRITDDLVVDLDTLAYIPRGNRLWPDDESLILPVAQPSFDDYYVEFIGRFSAWMEEVAKSNKYDSVLSCCSYVASGVSQFATDAAAMVAWRDALWTWAYQWKNGFNGDVPSDIPSWDDVRAQAPQPEDFGWVIHEA